MPLEGSAAFLCFIRSLNGPSAEWVPKLEQILGTFTNGFFEPEIEFEFNLPILPACKRVDLDNNGKPDGGVLVFAAIAAIDLFGDAYLEQLEQETGIGSIHFDAKTKKVRSGSIMIFSPRCGSTCSVGLWT